MPKSTTFLIPALCLLTTAPRVIAAPSPGPLPSPTPSASAPLTLAPDQPPLLAEVDGAGGITVRDSHLKVKTLTPGHQLQWGDEFELPPKTGARLAFDRGIQVIVTPGSDLLLQEKPDPVGARLVPIIVIDKGEIRVLVEDAPKADEDGNEDFETSVRSFKLFVSGRAAGVGDRGTDFIVSSDLKRTSVYTLKDSVEMSLSYADLMNGKSVRVTAGHYCQRYLATSEIQRPLSFDIASTMKSFHDRYPSAERLWKSAIMDTRLRKSARFFERLATQIQAQASPVPFDRKTPSR